MGRTFNPCDECEYAFHRQNEESGMCKICEYKQVQKELKLYQEEENQGLLPKFHLGDEFWTVRCGEVLKSKIVMLQQKKDGTWRYRFSQEISSKYHDTSDYEEKDYGKYFFDVKEEAEKLAEKKKKQWEEELKRLEEKRKQN